MFAKFYHRFFYGWLIVGGLFIIGLIGPMARYGLTNLFPFISSELNWSRSWIGLAQSFALWSYSLLVILTGWMVDHIGSRKTLFIGGALTFAGWLLFSSIHTLWQLTIFYGLVLAGATSMTHWVPLLGTSRKWFILKAGLVAGILTSASSVGTSIFSPLLTFMSDSFSWRTTALVCSFIFGIPVMFVAYVIVRNTPESLGMHPDGKAAPLDLQNDNIGILGKSSVKDVLKTPQFWLLFLAYSLMGVVCNAIMAHIVWAVDTGTAAATAGIFITFLQAPSIITRIGGGWLGDTCGRKRVMMLGALASSIVAVAGWIGIFSSVHLIIFVVVIGLSYSPAVTLFSAYVGDLFGRRNIGTLFSFLTFGWGSIGGLGPLIWGMIHDATGSYNFALLVSAGCFAIALLALAAIRPIVPVLTTSPQVSK